MKINFRPTVYMRDRTHTYLWIRDEDYEGLFLTMDSGSITLERIPLTGLKDDKIYTVYQDSKTTWELTPYRYDFLKALDKYHTSLLARTDEAEAEMAALLGVAPRPQVVTHQPKPMRAAGAHPEPLGRGYSLSQLCLELKMDPGEARQRLRKTKVQKPGGSWSWPNAEAALSVRKLLGG